MIFSKKTKIKTRAKDPNQARDKKRKLKIESLTSRKKKTYFESLLCEVEKEFWKKKLETKPKYYYYLPFATSATIGAAPEPVPPPIPAVTKTKSAPFTAVAISERLSSAACLPISGIPPAPSPRVTAFPIINLF